MKSFYEINPPYKVQCDIFSNPQLPKRNITWTLQNVRNNVTMTYISSARTSGERRPEAYGVGCPSG
jgi:hypothetical protein